MPKSPGVYLFKDDSGKIIYIGKARSLRDRVASYFRSKDLLPKTAKLVAEIAKVDYLLTESEIDALLLEANLIRKFAPKYNVNWKDGKAYPLIEITIKDKVPRVIIARHETPRARALYFGPYPTGADLTGLLRFLRRLFPFVSQNHPSGRACLRSHLGLCPCPTVFTDSGSRARYRRDLRNLIDFLRGKRLTVQKRLLSEMNQAARNQDFERAADLKRKIGQIELVTAPRTAPFEYETNPNLLTERHQEEIEDLSQLVNLASISKIEAYDIANIAGKYATGGQVVFVAGQPEKSLYRRYRIKRAAVPNDVAMIKEMLSRRLKSEVPLPELVVIDGGKGQLTAAISVLDKRVKIIALAKRLETIFSDDGREINLLANSAALHLLQRLRDEAHRFSRRYHFLLRRKSMLT